MILEDSQTAISSSESKQIEAEYINTEVNIPSHGSLGAIFTQDGASGANMVACCVECADFTVGTWSLCVVPEHNVFLEIGLATDEALARASEKARNVDIVA
ncbi:hypothetical protein CEXT_379071 [Caerostris extrusa]|uniref:Uncharacterized protein n=1 Tax=Caerostris extrusa TaxID=172846 RepID=A0AAV4P2P3_CAEEX|nr:hypothetical protein CEXT_379071 [Caerostris extrusa]